MTLATGTRDQTLDNARRILVSKLAGARVGIGLMQGARHMLQIAEVSSGSPLEGKVWPGDIVRGVGGAPVRLQLTT